MIDYIKGEISEITPTSVTLDNQGIGYYIQISLNTYSALAEKKDTKLYIHESIREDAHLLFGFFTKHERELFTLLISVSGIGAGTARMILSSFTAKELEGIIVSENVNVLKSVKGIGIKTAQRAIIDLKDKIKPSETTEFAIIQAPVTEEAIAAMVMLGFPQAASQKVVGKILKEHPDYTIEQVIKMALKLL